MADIRGGMTRNNSVSIPTSLGFNLASLGVPSGWRMLSGDAAQDPAWPNVYHSVDIISPWAVGRYGTIATADDFRRNKTEPDLAEAKRIGVDYMPVIFPGFSWHNLAITRGQSQYATNQIPRDCGRFYWHQFFNAIDAGSSMVFTAMFDEVDEPQYSRRCQARRTFYLLRPFCLWTRRAAACHPIGTCDSRAVGQRCSAETSNDPPFSL